MSSDRQWGFRTRAVHAGGRPDPTTGARAVPIYQRTSFVFEDTADAADLFALQKYGNIYTRIANPTVASFEEAGQHIVASSALYGGTYTLFDVSLRRLGIETTFVDPASPEAFAA